jgi:predicted acyl esterase
LLATTACTATDDDASAEDDRPTIDASVETAPATFSLQPGVEQVSVTGASPGDHLTIVDDDDHKLVTLLADGAGQANFAYVPGEYLTVQSGSPTDAPVTGGTFLAAGTYTMWNESTDPPQRSEPFEVTGVDDVPDPSTFEQDLTANCPDIEQTRECYTYIETRDGTTLSAMIRLPAAALGPGPYPTVIEYSGYAPSRDVGGAEPGSMIAGFFGYATVGVNMRGSGCSGGVFDVFSPAQQADGYDAVETVARQPWVKDNRPGMIGLSYSGISQLYVGATNPPSLAAITPMSVIDDPWRQQWPGGVYNNGFTKQWLAQRDAQSAVGGENWVTTRVEGGDAICEANLALRSQNPDFETFGRALEFYQPALDSRHIGLHVQDIDVPVYLTGAWQDEQTGPRFATMLDSFTGTDTKRFTLFNGHHPDGYSPLVITRWFEFLEFYVAKRTPVLNPLVRSAAPSVFEQNFGVPLGFEPDRFAGYPTYDAALAAYEAELPVRVLFESGGGMPGVPGAQVAVFEASFESWPPPSVERAEWFLGDAETLATQAPGATGSGAYLHDPAAGARAYTTEDAGAFQQPTIEFDWLPLEEGRGLSFVSEPLQQAEVLAGPGHVDLWIAPGAADAVVEANVSEIRPDGTEVRVQSGWLRLGHQGIDPALSDDFHVERTYSAEDFRPLVPGELIETKVPILPFAHPFRAGSRIRLTIETPGGNTPLWTFENPSYEGDVEHRVDWGGATPSSLVLMRVPGIVVPDGFPPCPGLRGQVCRTYVPIANLPPRGS